MRFLNEPQSLPGTRPQVQVDYRLCQRCGIELPASRFNQDGRTVKKKKNPRNLYPYHCRDCVSEVKKSEDR